MSNQNSNNNFYNFTATAVGYLNKVDYITPKKGDKYMIANVCVLSGRTDNPTKTWVSTTVKGREVEEFLNKNLAFLQDAIGKKQSVFIKMELGDLYPDSYVKDGGTVLKMGGRLLRITYCKTGDTVLLSKNDSQEDRQDQEQDYQSYSDQADQADQADQTNQAQDQQNVQPLQLTQEQIQAAVALLAAQGKLTQ